LFPPQGEDGHFIRKDVKDISTQARKEDAAPRKRLMLLPFLDASKDRPQSLRDNAKVEFIKELNLKSDMIVIDSSDLKVDFKNTLENGEYNLKEVARQGQSLGVLALLEGKIIDIRIKRKSDEVGVIRQMKSMFEVLVRVRLVATRSGSELLNVTKTVVLEDSQVRVAEDVSSDRLVKAAPHVVENLVKEAFLDFVPQIKLALEKLNWEGRVAMINGDRIFLNVGRQSGLQMGDILKVVDDGEDVFDPQTGVWIGKVPGRLKGTLEVVSYFGQDGAVTVIHSGAGFKENDKVELY
jgi:hypothetical protein